MQREGSSNYLEICPSGTRFYSIPNLNWEYTKVEIGNARSQLD